MSMHYLQVTIGASGTTQFTTARTPIREIWIENNATHTMRIGDSTVTSTKGFSLASGGAANSNLHLGPHPALNMDLTDFFVNGTATDTLDVLFVK